MASYFVKILTHARRGAGTTASVRIHRLTGTEGSAGPFPWMRDGFPSGSIVTTQINTDRGLGKLKELEIGHDSIGDAGTGWLLSGVKVRQLLSNTKLDQNTLRNDIDEDEAWFPCNKWLGESDAQDGESGPTRVVLKRLEGKHAQNVGEESFPRHKSTTENIHSMSKTAAKNLPLHKIETAAFALPEVSKIKEGVRAKISKQEGYAGEDAYFVRQDSSLFGVADGVSQWTESGINAGLFSRALVEGALRGGTMESAAAEAKSRQVKGSSTLTICRVDLPNAKCVAHVLGDSQVALVRDGHVVNRSVEQEHSFGVPFQLSSEGGRDQPEDCLEYEWDLKPDDYLVTGTDGLFDNVGDDEIARIVSSPTYPTVFNKAVALCQAAFNASQLRVGDTPYSRAASEALNLAFSGGKKDDITVVVSHVR